MASNISAFDPTTMQDINTMTNQYATSLDPQYDKSKRRLAEVLAGTGGLHGSAKQYGMSDIEGQKLGQIGQFTSGLQQAAQQQAYNRPFQEAGLTGMYGGNQTMAAKQADIQNAMQQAGITGQYQGNQTMQAKQADIQNAMAQAGLTGKYNGADTMANSALQASLTGMYNGAPTMQYQQSMLPWVTQGLVGKDALGNTLSGKIQTEREYASGSDMAKQAAKLGMNESQFALFNSMGAEKYEKLFGKLPIPQTTYEGGYIGGGGASAPQTPMTGQQAVQGLYGFNPYKPWT